MKTGWKARRRGFLLGGLGAGVAGMFPMLLDESPVRKNIGGRAGGIGGAVVPPTVVSLADYGGVPGASKAILVGAFSQAFAALAHSGGGTLLVPAGVYDFGNHADAASIISCRNLNNIAISAYGATFKANTTTTVVPHFFYFFNFQNVTIAGASFNDPGFTPWVNWRGMYCVGLQADTASSGFRMVDCYAERVLGLLATNNNAATRSYLSDVSVQGEVHYAYYGVGASFIKEHVNVDLVCHNVRRAFIAYALKNASITVTSSSTSSWPGSNGLIALVSAGASMGNVENVRVKVDTSGASIHSSYVHFYHQGPELEGCMRNIDATVNVINADATATLFMFDHETNGVLPTTARIWDQIFLHGSVTGKFAGKIISNTSVSTSRGTVYVDANLAGRQNAKSLPAGFRIHLP
jgi:hypothetical protein